MIFTLYLITKIRKFIILTIIFSLITTQIVMLICVTIEYTYNTLTHKELFSKNIRKNFVVYIKQFNIIIITLLITIISWLSITIFLFLFHKTFLLLSISSLLINHANSLSTLLFWLKKLYQIITNFRKLLFITLILSLITLLIKITAHIIIRYIYNKITHKTLKRRKNFIQHIKSHNNATRWITIIIVSWLLFFLFLFILRGDISISYK